ncbi:hypothetical protein BGZ76_007487 [Entomortierella beljakovae]|nr:hypothetical protein BGZ76_007487 [Entomortierella beljakovae]
MAPASIISRLYFLSTLTLGFLATTSFAQSQSATIVSNAGYFRYGSKFYIIGGGIVRENEVGVFGFTEPVSIQGAGQFTTLDLSQTLDTSKPIWNKLQSGPKNNGLTAAISSDGKRVVSFEPGNKDNFVSLYDVDSNIWVTTNITVPSYSRTGVFPVADPTTNKVYLAGGFLDGNLNQMYIYDFTTNTMTNNTMSSGMVGILNYKAVWWSTKQCIIYFGGNIATGARIPSADNAAAPNTLNMYCPGTDTWSTLATTGEAPNRRTDICMAISDDGNQLVIYGGRHYPSFHEQVVSSDIFLLDLNTMKWVANNIDSKPRMYAACTIHNGDFILWGGTDTVTTVSDPFIVVKTEDISSKKATSSKNAIIGGVCGGVAFIIIVALCYRFCCRRRNPLTRANNENIKLSYTEANRIVIDSQTHIITPVRLGSAPSPSTPKTLPSTPQVPPSPVQPPLSPPPLYRAYPKLNTQEQKSYPVLNPQEANSYPVLNPQEANSYPVSNPQGANSYPALNLQNSSSYSMSNPQDSSSYSMSNPQDSSSYLLLHPQSSGVYPVSNPQELVAQQQIEMESRNFSQPPRMTRSPQAVPIEVEEEEIVSSRIVRGPEILGFLATLSFAQSSSSTIVSNAGYFRYGSKFYIVGGGIVREVKKSSFGFPVSEFITGEGQFIVLDLSQPQYTSNSAWNKLQSGPKNNGLTAAISSDGKRVVSFEPDNKDNFVSLYDVDSNTWVTTNITVTSSRTGIFPVADPTTNKVYLAGGFSNDQLDQMYIYDFTTNNMTNIPMSSDLVGIVDYKGVWWTDDGNQLVVYGGKYRYSKKIGAISNDIYLLDLTTMEWVANAVESRPREYAACTIYNGDFVLWGGTDTTTTVSDPFIVMKTKDIVSKAAITKRNIIIGGVCGGIAFIVVVALCCLCCCRFFCRRRYPFDKRDNENIKMSYTEANRIIVDSQTQIITPVRLGPSPSTPQMMPSQAQSPSYQTDTMLNNQEQKSNPVLSPQGLGSYPVLNPQGLIPVVNNPQQGQQHKQGPQLQKKTKNNKKLTKNELQQARLQYREQQQHINAEGNNPFQSSEKPRSPQATHTDDDEWVDEE